MLSGLNGIVPEGFLNDQMFPSRWKVMFADSCRFKIFAPDFKSSTCISRIAIKCCTDFHAPQRMSPNDFSNFLTFLLVPHYVDICGFE